MLSRKIRDVLRRGRKPSGIREYYYIKYTLSVLRVIAWIVLVLGCLGSLVWGITVGGFAGALRILIGIVASFLVWLALIAAREVLKLFADVKKNTGTTAQHILGDSD